MSVDTKPKAGLEDVDAGESAICYLDGERGVLAYQGYDIHDLADAQRGVSFEETCFLLWHGRLPTRAELGDLQTQLAAARVLPDSIIRAMRSVPKVDAMDALRGLTVEPYRSIGQTGGVLAVGGPADITVLDRDPRTVTPDSLGEAVVLLTVVDGRVVVDAGDRAPVTTAT